MPQIVAEIHSRASTFAPVKTDQITKLIAYLRGRMARTKNPQLRAEITELLEMAKTVAAHIARSEGESDG